MNLEKALKKRADNACELCSSEEDLHIYTVLPSKESKESNSLYACKNCISQINGETEMNPNHWRCLNDSMWSEYDAVKVVAWRMLNRLKTEGWPQDLLEMMYLQDEVLEWAKATGEGEVNENSIVHRDANGTVLAAGDSVVLIKDLKVKGSSIVAKQGTAVRRISLDYENEDYIEGKIDGQNIVIVTKFVKKI